MQETVEEKHHPNVHWAHFEKLLLSISSQFISLPYDQIDNVIEESQRQICEVLGFDLSALWQWSDKDGRVMTLTHLYSPPGGPQRPVEIDAANTFPWILNKMRSGETLAFSTDQLTEEAAVDRASRSFYGVKSSVDIPLMISGQLIGILTFDTLWENRTFGTEDISRLNIVAEIFTNTLARKITEERLIESETRFALAVDSAGAGVWELNVDTGIFWATDRALAIFGYDSEEIISMERFEKSIYPDDLALVRTELSATLDHGKHLSVVYRIHTNDGSIKWINSIGRPYLKPSGETDRVLGVSTDITTRKLAEEELKESQKDLQQLAGRLIEVKEEELRRLSRELHDDLSQSLAVLAIEAGKLERDMTEEDLCLSGPREKVVQIKDQLIKISEDVHRISRQLHPTILDDLGLIRAIESECEALRYREELTVLLRTRHIPEQIPNNVSLCIYRIIQEGLNNVIRHSKVRECTINLQGMLDSLDLTITDEGIGFAPEEVRLKPGLGLSSMRERVLFVQGDFSITSRRGSGTTIQVRVPLNEVLI